MLAIIDYKAGNLTSVRLALNSIDVEGTITSEPDLIARADRIIFPGVGAAGSAMQNLRQLGLDQAIREAVRRGTPLLGICLGMQVLLDFSEEDGGTELLGLIPGQVLKFKPEDQWTKVPQIGWNEVCPKEQIGNDPLFANIAKDADFYFVHSYYTVPTHEEHVAARTEYAQIQFASVLRKDNLLATQFHPEKSGQAGMQLLRNFINLN